MVKIDLNLIKYINTSHKSILIGVSICISDLETENDLEKRAPVETVNTSGSFSSRTSSDLLNSENGSSRRLLVSSNTVSSTMFERIRGQTKNEYVEVYTNDDDSDTESVIESKKQKILDTTEVKSEHSLAYEAVPPLLVSVAGLMSAGWLLDVVQYWPVFTKVTELFVLVPVLLNLKGNLEMNLASRLSTLSNLGELDKPSVRYALVWGNLAVLQVQSLIVGAVAGLFSFLEGVVFHSDHVSTFHESILVIVASMVCAALSSMILGTFMCVLIILCRRFRINPDNIACPMASSLGDLLTLIILATCGEILLQYLHTYVSTAMFLILAASIPLWVRFVWSNPTVHDLLVSGWSPLFMAMVIASMAGLVLERYIEHYNGLALLTPVLNGIAGNLGSIYASRISTRLHSGEEENYRHSEIVLFLIHIPIEIVFLIFAWWFDIGHVNLSWSFSITYLFVSIICVAFTLFLSKMLTLWLWHNEYDPDNYSLPYITAIVDVVGTGLLAFSYWGLSEIGLHVENHIKKPHH
ncbi:solute carrier family 41 member 1-like [Rhizophagus irregularis DAOM 181602=DAOM 197198]|nr:solute carrier family 41 member 1-like [Rhizophagus irregularis DAOM 181602=DAOM 197198]